VRRSIRLAFHLDYDDNIPMNTHTQTRTPHSGRRTRLRIGTRVAVPNGERGVVDAISPCGDIFAVELAGGDRDYFDRDELRVVGTGTQED
jgi:hypothetical protein